MIFGGDEALFAVRKYCGFYSSPDPFVAWGVSHRCIPGIPDPPGTTEYGEEQPILIVSSAATTGLIVLDGRR